MDYQPLLASFLEAHNTDIDYESYQELGGQNTESWSIDSLT